MDLAFGAYEMDDFDWGCTYQEVISTLGTHNIKICLAKVKSLDAFATQITDLVLDSSWMTKLDTGTRRAYKTTVSETAAALVAVFRLTSTSGTIGAEFGEVMVSIGSARALEKIFSHAKIPVAELWKPQVKQNEGFDFHTVCSNELVNFGEAKYSAKGTPHGLAIKQADDFIESEKHLRDRVHLINFIGEKSLENLDSDQFGVIAAFSVNAKNPLSIFQNAYTSAGSIVDSKKITAFYLVGVFDEC